MWLGFNATSFLGILVECWLAMVVLEYECVEDTKCPPRGLFVILVPLDESRKIFVWIRWVWSGNRDRLVAI